MKVTCTLTIEYPSKKHATDVLHAVQVDDVQYVHSQTHGKILTADITADSAKSLLHTLDDYLACVNIASKIVNKN